MINIRIQGDKEILRGLEGVLQEIPRGASDMLDMAARETQMTMASEAPHGRGTLASSIRVTAPDALMRTIEPFARSASGSFYPYWVEKGTTAGGSNPSTVPNIFSIMEYYGVDKKMAWAIALGIARKGTPMNAFVLRTFEWIQGRLPMYMEQFGVRIQARYIAGR